MRGSLVIISAPAADPETSNTTSAPAAACFRIHQPDQVRLPRVHRFKSQLDASLSRKGLTSETMTRAPFVLATQRDQHADRPAAQHNHEFARFHFAQPHVMAGHRDRLDQRALLEREMVRQAMQRVRGHGPQALHGAGRVDADEFQFLADVAVAVAAGGASAAGVERTDGDAVARAPIR